MSQLSSVSVNSQTVNNFALYYYPSCPFCGITLQAIKSMNGLKIEHRDILKTPEYRTELIKKGGKSQVPCLKIEKYDGTLQWLYESRDIIAFLKRYSADLSSIGNIDGKLNTAV